MMVSRAIEGMHGHGSMVDDGKYCNGPLDLSSSFFDLNSIHPFACLALRLSCLM